MNKTEAVKIISKCAKLYKNNLDGNQVVFVYHDENNHSKYTEVKFRSYNFLHFTGVTLRNGLNANDFYRFALNNRLSERDFSFKNNHTTELKLKVLETIMSIDTKARMIGNYMGPHMDLYTEKVTGTTTACLGLIEKENFYIPNSVLSEDIRSIVPKPPGKIFVIFKKNINSTLYNQLTFKSPHLKITEKCLPINLVEYIDPSLLEKSNDENDTENAPIPLSHNLQSD
ncbi:MAG: PBECR4 domain-containing protein [Lachnospiraceae bacterium]